MTQPAPYLTISDCEQEAEALLERAAVLYGGSAALQKLRDLAGRYLNEMRGLLANRGITAPTIGFIGDKDAGKSHLLRMLIADEAVRAQIPCGMGDEGRTEKLTWVGADLPKETEPGAELGLRLHDPLTQLNLHEDVTLVDIPGFNDSHGPAAHRARALALKSCQVKLLVFDQAAATAERAGDFARLAPGPIIVPILNRMRSAPESAEARKAAATYEKSIRAAIEDAGNGVIIHPAVLIPDGKIGLEEPASTLARLVKAAKEAVAEVRRTPHLGQSTAQARRDRFFNDVRRVLESDYRKIAELLARLEAAAQAVPRELLPHLLGSERTADAAIRIWLRAEVLHRTPAYFFPLRSFLGLFALTSRAWDSLLLAIGGSVPSLFTTLFSIAGSVRVLRSRRHGQEDDALERTVRRIVLEKQHADLSALREHFEAMSARPTPADSLLPLPQVEGLGELRAAAAESFERVIRDEAMPRWVLHLAGWLSLACWFVLLHAPLRAVYGQYFATLWRSLQSGAGVSWMEFPVPPVSTVMGWIMLAFLPIFAGALLLQALAAKERRVKRCRAAMENAIRAAMDEFTARGVLALKLRDAKLEAGRWLYEKVFGRFGPAHFPGAAGAKHE